MPGKHGKKGKKGGGISHRLAFFLSLLFCTWSSFAFYPHKGEVVEFRMEVESEHLKDFKWTGHIAGGSLLHDKVKVAGLLTMQKDKSHMKGLVEFKLNQYIKLGVAAGLDQKMSGVGDFIITGDIPITDYLDILPFIQVSHEALSQAGFLLYFTLKQVVFNIGGSFQPAISDHQKQRFSFMIGTGLNNIKP